MPPTIRRTMLRTLPWLMLLQCDRGLAADLEGSVGLSSDNVFRGLTQSQGDASIQANGYASSGHWFGGLGAESVKRSSDAATGVELIGHVGYQQPLTADWYAALSARHYDYPGNPYRSRYVYDELSATLGWGDHVAIDLIVSPNTYAAAEGYRYGRGGAYAVQIGARQPLAYGATMDAGVGGYDLRQQIGASYVYWSGGVGYQRGRWQLGVHYIGTNAEARHLFGGLAGDRIVASAAWSFF